MAGIMESLKGRKGRKSPPSSAASEDAKAPGATVTATGPEASSPPNAATVACKEPAIQVIRSPTIDVGTMTSPGQEDEGTGGPGAGAAEKAKGKEKEKAGQREEGYKWLVGPVAGAFLGNALLLGVGCLLVLLWQLFEEFREPLLWGLWFSVVLRSTKEWLVAMLGKYLRERSLLSVLFLPAEMVLSILARAWSDVASVAISWLSGMNKKTTHRRALLTVQTTAAKGEAEKATNEDEADDDFQDCSEAEIGQAMAGAKAQLKGAQSFASWCVECGMLVGDAVRELVRARAEQRDAISKKVRPSESSILFYVLLSCCILYEAFRWTVGLVGLPLLLGSAVIVTASAATFVCVTVVRGYFGREALSRQARDKLAHIASFFATSYMTGKGVFTGALSRAAILTEGIDRRARAFLLDGLDKFVAAFLCLMLLVGTLAAVIFFSIQTGQEMHGAVKAAMSVEVGIGSVTQDGIKSYVPEWALEKIAEGQAQAISLARDHMPRATKLMEDKTHELLQRYELTETVSELYIMYATLQHLPCTEEEEHEFAVESAKANAKHRRAVSELEAARKELEDAERGIQLSVARWRGVTGSGSAFGVLQMGAEDSPWWERDEPPTAEEAEQLVTAADQRLRSATQAVAEAQGVLDSSAGVAALAAKKLHRCVMYARTGGKEEHALVSSEIVSHLQATLQLVMQFKFTMALEQLQDIANELAQRVQNLGVSRDLAEGVDTGKLNNLASVGHAVLDTLLNVGQTIAMALFASVGSSTSMVFSGGASIISTLLNALRASLEFVSFVGLLYFLLSLDEDPIDTTLNSLPVSPESRENVDKAIRMALSGVFEVTAKMAFFHGVFTWLTLRMAGVHFIYLPTLAAAILACFPLIPIMVVLVPAILELVMSGCWFRLVLLLLAHLSAGSADDIIAEDVPGNSPFLTGMAIAGGMATFESPFKGALLGPLVVAVVLALQRLATLFSSSQRE